MDDTVLLTQASANRTQAVPQNPLDPSSIPVDGRSQRDRLAYAAQYARLIYYFNSQNQRQGDWQEFFLKDPAILLAAISKTDYASYHAQYVRIAQQRDISSNGEIDAEFVNQLCQLLRNMFVAMAHWFAIMERNVAPSSLYEFLKHKITTCLATQLWLAIAIEQAQHLATKGKVGAPDLNTYRQFSPIWKTQQGDLRQYGVDGNVPNTLQQISILKQVYRTVLDVFVQVIDYAGEVYLAEQDANCEYPDTALLRVFCTLMETQQAQINQYGKAHLDFYYQRVLQLAPSAAQADEVIVCLSLANPLQTLTLPAATNFLAGSYPDQTPIKFSNPSAETVTGVGIGAAYTVCRTENNIALSTVSKPNVVQRNSAQEILNWDAFGNAQGVMVQTGFAIASPMLSLQGGTRTITLTITLAPKTATTTNSSNTTNANPWSASDFPNLGNMVAYLSTAQAWWSVAPNPVFLAPNQIQLTLSLTATDPPIVPMTANPDGYSSQWPIIKIVCANVFDLSNVPNASSVSIEVTVTDMAMLASTSNVSSVPSVEPGPAFGPLPVPGSGFYLALPECLAKPVTSLSVLIPWENLPVNFSAYYIAYNTYLLAQPSQVAVTTFQNTSFQGLWSVLNASQWQSMAVTPVLQAPPSSNSENNGSGSSSVNSSGSASNTESKTEAKADSATLTKPETAPAPSVGPVSVFQQLTPTPAPTPLPTPTPASTPLEIAAESYAVAIETATVLAQNQVNNLPASGFSLTFPPKMTYVPAPDLLVTPVKAPMQARDGYLRFQLSAPADGFGNSIYPQVVGFVTLANGQILIAEATGQTDTTQKNNFQKLWDWIKSWWSTPVPAVATLLPMPNVPYIPVQTGPSVTYTATATTSLTQTIMTSTSGANPYPLEMYHYGIFKNTLVFDTQAKGASLAQSRLSPGGPSAQFNCVPLVPGVGTPGCLYLALTGVSTPNTLTLFVEVSGHVTISDREQIEYWYWTQTGWQQLPVLQDGTRELTSSGIIKLALPAVPVPPSGTAQVPYIANPLMPTADFWLAITNAADSSCVKFSYLNTQAVRLVRSDLSHLPPGTLPRIPDNAISTPPLPSIASVVQAFPSYGGLPSETMDAYDGVTSFYQRTSERLRGKDRVSSIKDIEEMVQIVCPDLFHVDARAGTPGTVSVGLVRRYANAQMPNAFRPQFGPSEMEAVGRQLSSRGSALANYAVVNLGFQEVQIACTLSVTANANVATMTSDVNQMLKLFLSPWIDVGANSKVAQMSITQGLYRSDLLNLLGAVDSVAFVSTLNILVSSGNGASPQIDLRDHIVPNSGNILVTSLQHQITIVWADVSTGAT